MHYRIKCRNISADPRIFPKFTYQRIIVVGKIVYDYFSFNWVLNHEDLGFNSVISLINDIN